MNYFISFLDTNIFFSKKEKKKSVKKNIIIIKADFSQECDL